MENLIVFSLLSLLIFDISTGKFTILLYFKAPSGIRKEAF